VKFSFIRVWSAAFSLFDALLNVLRSSGAWVFCHVALAFLFNATKHLILDGKYMDIPWGLVAGVAR
jgi:hypothetical protein